jgi:[ribosomal protein S18]-alanine N-acetyltransferase
MNHLASLEILTQRTEAVDAFRITEVLSSDIPEVLTIEQVSNPEPWTQDAFLEELLRPHSYLLVARVPAEFGEMVAGYICFWLVADEVQILNIAVHQAYRRQGIGRALLAHCLNFGFEKKTRKAVLEVRSSNLAAQRLYRSLGFEAVGQRLGYYGGAGEHAVLMERNMVDQHVSGGHERWRKSYQLVATERS